MAEIAAVLMDVNIVAGEINLLDSFLRSQLRQCVYGLGCGTDYRSATAAK